MKAHSTERPGLPRCDVFGTRYYGRAKTVRKHCDVTMGVQLRREPNNFHDPNAVSVWVEVPGFFGARKMCIGYLKRSHAKRVAKALDNDNTLWAQIYEIYDPEDAEYPYVSLNVGYE